MFPNPNPDIRIRVSHISKDTGTRYTTYKPIAAWDEERRPLVADRDCLVLADTWSRYAFEPEEKAVWTISDGSDR